MMIYKKAPVDGTERVISWKDDPRVPNLNVHAKQRWQSRPYKTDNGYNERVLLGATLHNWQAVAIRRLVRYRPSMGARAIEVMHGHWSTKRAGSYHFYIDFDGTIYQAVDFGLRAAFHAGVGGKEKKTIKNFNGHFVGIGLAQGMRNAQGKLINHDMTIDSVESAIWLLRRLAQFFGSTRPVFLGGTSVVPLDVLEEIVGSGHGFTITGHCHNKRGKPNDPGLPVWRELLKAGFALVGWP